MKAVVTGATGFLGGALVRELLKNGDEVTILARPGSKRLGNLDEFKNATVLEKSLEEEFLLPSDGRYEVFFHLAWGGARNDFEEQYRNIGNTINCLRAAVKAGCRRFVCTGSQAEYGETKDLITEETPLRPVTAYGNVKAAAHHLCEAFLRDTGTDLVWARVFSVYGEHDNPNTLYSRLMEALKKGEDFILSTDGTHMWNYLYEGDAARALRMLASANTPADVYNVASGESRPLKEYVESVKNALNPKVNITYGTEKSGVSLNADVRKLKSAVGEFELIKQKVVKSK